jgi:Rrf2 family transcriptional regulator, nitric oxide-sensitive transcriptional repressor
MRLTVYADYSLRVLIYLALCTDRAATIPEIADSYGISRNHLVKVTHQLGVKEFILTTRGRNGGIRLARPASEIRVGEIVRRMEPDLALVPCFSPVDSNCAILPSCVLRNALAEARDAFLAQLDRYTLQDLAAPRSTLLELLSIAPAAPAA